MWLVTPNCEPLKQWLFFLGFFSVNCLMWQRKTQSSTGKLWSFSCLQTITIILLIMKKKPLLICHIATDSVIHPLQSDWAPVISFWFSTPNPKCTQIKMFLTNPKEKPRYIVRELFVVIEHTMRIEEKTSQCLFSLWKWMELSVLHSSAMKRVMKYITKWYPITSPLNHLGRKPAGVMLGAGWCPYLT